MPRSQRILNFFNKHTFGNDVDDDLTRFCCSGRCCCWGLNTAVLNVVVVFVDVVVFVVVVVVIVVAIV